jgi:hypothetical protein
VLTDDAAKDWIIDRLEDYVPPPVPFSGFAMPVIQRVMPQVSIADIMAVQPMAGPTAQVFYRDFRQSWWKRIWQRIFRRGSSVSRAGR